MMQKKPNLELAQAQVDAQPPMKVFKPHPKKKGVMQLFSPSFKIDKNANRIMDYGKSLGDYVKCQPGEKHDAMIYSHEDSKPVGYKKA